MNPSALSGSMNRRGFLTSSTLGGSGLLLAFYFKSAREATAAHATAGTSEVFSPNALIRISPQGVVTLISKRPEMGQGVKTALPMVIAEQLEVSWKDIVIEQGDLNSAYGDSQGAGGSASTPTDYEPFHLIGATARTMLVEAAAQTWNVPAGECYAKNAAVHHRPSGKTLKYGALVATASKLPVPEAAAVKLKQPGEYTLLGTRVGGVDNPKVVTGQPLFGIDVKVPGMLYAVYERCPAFGGKVVSANLDQIKSMPGVRDAFIIEGKGNVRELVPGVAIVADSTWNALSARKQLKVVWDEGKVAGESWDAFVTQARQRAAQPGAKQVRKDGDIAAGLTGAAKVVEGEYLYPFVSHATLEPQNTTAHFKDGAMEVWSPTQMPIWGQQAITRLFGIPTEKITFHITRNGGAFGRRTSVDFVVEAAAIALKVNAPVKLTWTREDDLKHDHYRPGGLHFLKGGVDGNGKIVAWKNHFFTFGYVPGQASSGLGAEEFPSRRIPNYLAEQTLFDTGWPMGPWRAPNSCVFAWVFQSFLDELAHAGGRDPVELRLELLDASAEIPAKAGGSGRPNPNAFNAVRMRNLVKFTAEKADWGKNKFAKGQGAGIAFHFSHRGYFVQVAEVTVAKDGQLKVDRVVCGCDIGAQIINLSGAENQVEGSVVDGLSTLMFQELNIERGRIVQSNFNDYPLLRMPDAPTKIETHFLRTNYPTTGLGEPALPPLAPAVCNAIFAATGKRIREMPLSRTNLRWS